MFVNKPRPTLPGHPSDPSTPGSSSNNDRNERAPRRPKRNLIDNACLACRKRKSRCDGLRPKCSSCQGKATECSYEAEEGESRQGALRRKLALLETQLGDLKELLSFVQARPDGEAQQLFQRIRANNYEDPFDILRQAKNGDFVDYRGHSDQTTRRLPPIRSMVDVPSYSGSRAGEGLMAPGVTLTGDEGRPVAGREAFPPSFLRPEYNVQAAFWTKVTSSDQLVSHLLSVYFRWDHPIHNFFDKELFTQDLINRRSVFCSSLLVNAILAVACTHSPLTRDAVEPWKNGSIHMAFQKESVRLWNLEQVRDTLTTILTSFSFQSPPPLGRQPPIPVPSYAQPNQDPAIFQAFCHLAIIQNKICTALYGVTSALSGFHPSPEQTEILYQNLVFFQNSLTAALNIDQDASNDSERLLLHMNYHSIVLRLFKPFLSAGSSAPDRTIQYQERARSISSNSARHLWGLLNRYRLEYNFKICSVVVLQFMAVGAFTALDELVLGSESSMELREVEQAFIVCTRGLQTLGENIYFAQPVLRTVSMTIKSLPRELHLSQEAESILSSWDTEEWLISASKHVHSLYAANWRPNQDLNSVRLDNLISDWIDTMISESHSSEDETMSIG